MSVSVTMPRLGESVSEGTVTRWLKKEGERVEADEPLLEVSTDKVDTEIPSPSAGVLTKIVVAEDETVEVGAELAVIDENGQVGGAATQEAAPAPAAQPEPQPEPEPAPAPAPVSSIPQPAPAQAPAPAPAPAQAPAPVQPAPAAPAPAQQAPAAAEPTALPSSGDSPYVTPLVRKLANEHGVDLEAITGTGVGGRIRKQDVLEA